MKLFTRSLTRNPYHGTLNKILTNRSNGCICLWILMTRFGFNVKNEPHWFYIQYLKKKPSEFFRDYAIRCRFEAVSAKSPMEESQMKDYFIPAKEPQYYDRMMLVVEKSFADMIKLGERVEEGIKNETIINLEALRATNKAL